MLQHTTTIENRYKRFIQQVVDTEIIWGLKAADGWATAPSNEYEDTDVMPFWSDSAFCKACAKEEWAQYTATKIPLAEFLESWCVGLHQDDLLVGVNWDLNLFGKEEEPLVLALAILNQLKQANKTLFLCRYDSQESLQALIEQALRQERAD